MTEHTRRMSCPRCGGEMNHHADKVEHALGDEEAGGIDPAFGGVLQEIHGCPPCGHVEVRRVAVPSAPRTHTD